MKAEDPMAMMREAHRELSASYQQVAASKKYPQDLADGFA